MSPLYIKASGVCRDVLSAAGEIRRQVGVGMSADTYRKQLKRALELREHTVLSGVPLDPSADGEVIDLGRQADLLVDGCLVVEVKSRRDALTEDDVREVRSYARGTGAPMGVVLNYGTDAGDFSRVGEIAHDRSL